MNSKPHEALILLSGGIDSTACVCFLRQQNTTLRALFVNYGQASAPQEENSARAVASHYDVPLSVVRCSGVESKTAGLVSGRNAFLVFTALMEAQMDAGLIALGIHAGTRYWDCSAEFVDGIQHVVDGYAGGKIRLSLPFLAWSKREIWEFCQTSKIPVDLTYSCEMGKRQPCGQCYSCRDLKSLYAC